VEGFAVSFTYNPITGAAYSDLEDFSAWCAELELARAAWLDVLVRKHVPRKVYEAGWKFKTKARSRDFAKAYLRQNGYSFAHDPAKLSTVLMRGSVILSMFNVALQPPERGKCRVCGARVEPTRSDDQCGNCDLENRLANKFKDAGWNVKDIMEGRAGMGDVA